MTIATHAGRRSASRRQGWCGRRCHSIRGKKGLKTQEQCATPKRGIQRLAKSGSMIFRGCCSHHPSPNLGLSTHDLQQGCGIGVPALADAPLASNCSDCCVPWSLGLLSLTPHLPSKKRTRGLQFAVSPSRTSSVSTDLSGLWDRHLIFCSHLQERKGHIAPVLHTLSPSHRNPRHQPLHTCSEGGHLGFSCLRVS